VTSIVGHLLLNYNHSLPNLSGLDNLTSIGGGLALYVNLALTSLTGLENLNSIGGQLFFSGNYALTNLAGLEELSYVGGNFTINGSYALANLAGMSNLTSVGGYIEINSNPILSNMSGLESLASIGGYLSVNSNIALKSLDGLDNIASGSVNNLIITYNDSLSDCAVESLCNYLASPAGTIEIHDNAPGCNSPTEVEEACLISVGETGVENQITLFPNPADKTISIGVNDGFEIEEVFISNHLGQVVLQKKPVNNFLDVSALQPGVYFIEINSNQSKTIQKIIIQ
jgi:hypothetical protein